MFKTATKAALAATVAALSLSACTVSEPEMPSGDASSMRLSAITAAGMTIMKVGYDNSNRMKSINYGNEFKVDFDYGTSTLTVPETITVSEFEEQYVNDDKYEWQLSEQEVWTNIQADADGHITHYDCTGTRWEESYDYESGKYNRVQITELSTESYTYDADGHLVRNTVRDFDDFGQARTLVATYTWHDGLLTEYSDNDTDHNEGAVYDYSDVDNVHGQWDPHTKFGPIMISGLFGKAPAKFMSKETYLYQGYATEETQYSYTLTENGLIRYAKVFDQYGDAIVMNYVYTLKK